jgi:Ohr subfamily peroxiredoxin
MKVMYSTSAAAVGGRNGKVISEDGVLSLDVRIPKEMGGEGGAYTNPEQLFAAGYAACFDSALNYNARRLKLRITSKTRATVSLVMGDESQMDLSVNLDVSMEGVDREKALELLDLAHATCPYSRALRNNVEVRISLEHSLEVLN